MPIQKKVGPIRVEFVVLAPSLAILQNSCLHGIVITQTVFYFYYSIYVYVHWWNCDLGHWCRL